MRIISAIGCDEIEARGRAAKARKQFNQALIPGELEIARSDAEMKLDAIDPSLAPNGRDDFTETFRQKTAGGVRKSSYTKQPLTQEATVATDTST